MFKIFNKTNKKETNEYNIWLTAEIKRCKLFNIDLCNYINKDMHPLHVKWIAQALIDGISPENVKIIANTTYTNEEDIKKLYDYYMINPDVNYYVKSFVPKNLNTINSKESTCYYGAIIGDIIGQPYEFTEHGTITNLIRNSNFFTDDTVLTIATLNAIKECKIDPDYRKHYIKMYNEFKNAGYGSGYIRWCIGNEIDNKIGYGSYANGSAMRISPIPAIYENVEDVIKQAVLSSSVTHNHIDGVKGAVVTAVCIWMAKNKYSREDIKEYLYEHYYYTSEQRKEMTNGFCLFDLDKGDNNKFDNQYSLFCNFAVPYAIWCFLETSSFEDCMKKVLSHFCDSDTICSIAGAISFEFYDLNINDFNIDEKIKDIKKYLI